MTITPTPAEALRAGIDLINGDLTGAEWKRACRDFIKQATAALAAAPQPMGCGLPCGYDCNGACFVAAAPQPAPEREALVEVIEQAWEQWKDLPEDALCEFVADALLAKFNITSKEDRNE